MPNTPARRPARDRLTSKLAITPPPKVTMTERKSAHLSGWDKPVANHDYSQVRRLMVQSSTITVRDSRPVGSPISKTWTGDRFGQATKFRTIADALAEKPLPKAPKKPKAKRSPAKPKPYRPMGH